MDELPFGLARQETYAALSAQDLESLGKEASNMFLCDGMSLNDAVVKLAQQHPSISPHQVKRVVEFANTETFQKLFEKQADDKNIDFPVAEPGPILRNLDLGARGSVSTPTPSEYESAPVKMAQAQTVEADLKLAEMFGIDLTPESMTNQIEQEKTAQVVSPADRILPAKIPTTPVGRILMTKEADSMKQLLLAAGAAGLGSGLGYAATAPEGARDLGDIAGVGLTGATLGGLLPEKALTSGLIGAGAGALSGGIMHHPKLLEMMKKRKAVEAALEKGAQDPLMAGPAPEAMGATPQQTHHEQMLQMTRQVELEKKKQELASIQQKTIEMMQGPPPGQPGEGASVEPPPEVAAAMQGPSEGGGMGGPAAGPPGPPAQGPQAGPPPGAEGPIPEKVGSALLKQALDYAKSGRPLTDLVVSDLEKATSIERIKEACADPNPYPQHNPHRELIEARVTLLKLAEDANHARDKNEYLFKEAMDQWGHVVTQHILDGGNFGEVAHAVAHVDDSADSIKLAMASLQPYLEHHQIEPARMHAQLIKYEMEKTAERRQVNPANPIVQAYATMMKLAEGQQVLNESANQLNVMLEEANKLVGQVLRADQIQ